MFLRSSEHTNQIMICTIKSCQTTSQISVLVNHKIFEKMPEKEAGRYGDRAFTQMMYAKVVTVQLVNRMGYDVLFQDVDLGKF